MAEFLKTQAIEYAAVSEYIRCQQTATIISQHTGLQFATDPRLNEHHQESFDQLVTRVQQLLTEYESLPAQQLFLCTHGAVIAAFKNLLLKGSFTLEDELDYPPTGQLWLLHNKQLDIKDFI